MAEGKRRGNAVIAAPQRKRTAQDGIITTLHPEGSYNDIKIPSVKRELVRPKIYFWKAALNVLIPLIICAVICWRSVLYAFVGLGIYALIRLRGVIIWFIRVYQSYASEDVRLACVFEPSCSEYMILCIEKYGVIFGCVKGIKRLKRCHLPNGGEDYP